VFNEVKCGLNLKGGVLSVDDRVPHERQGLGPTRAHAIAQAPSALTCAGA